MPIHFSFNKRWQAHFRTAGGQELRVSAALLERAGPADDVVLPPDKARGSWLSTQACWYSSGSSCGLNRALEEISTATAKTRDSW